MAPAISRWHRALRAWAGRDGQAVRAPASRSSMSTITVSLRPVGPTR